MARVAREENDGLKARIAALETQVGATRAGPAQPPDPPAFSESSP
jgi:BMFP domain-containing protein YqiC